MAEYQQPIPKETTASLQQLHIARLAVANLCAIKKPDFANEDRHVFVEFLLDSDIAPNLSRIVLASIQIDNDRNATFIHTTPLEDGGRRKLQVTLRKEGSCFMSVFFKHGAGIETRVRASHEINIPDPAQLSHWLKHDPVTWTGSAGFTDFRTREVNPAIANPFMHPSGTYYSHAAAQNACQRYFRGLQELSGELLTATQDQLKHIPTNQE